MKWDMELEDREEVTHGFEDGYVLIVSYGERFQAVGLPEKLEPMDVADRLITLGKNIQKDLARQKELEIKGG